MKKLSILVSCFAVLLVLSNVSFAQEEVAVAAPCTCTCSACGAATLPFAYPSYCPAPKFGSRLSALVPKCPLASHASPCPPQALPIPAPPASVAQPGAPAVRPFAARRAARLALQPQLPPLPPPGMLVPPPPGPAFYPPAALPQYPNAQMGDSNKVLQHVGGAPVINFLSVVRAPRPYGPYDPYAGYYYQYPQPATAPAN